MNRLTDAELEAMRGHTPGPWTIGAKGNQDIDVDAPNGDPTLCYDSWDGLCQVYGCEESPDKGQIVCENNARLIAASPAMYAELIERRAQDLVVRGLAEALEAILGPKGDPTIGWRGITPSRPILFACEFCREEHLDCTEIAHADDCPIVLARAALAKLQEASNG